MVIVLFTIIVMGGATEFVLDRVGIEMGVDEDDYMLDWHKHRGLKGTFHDFEMKYLYSCIMRELDKDDDISDDEGSLDDFGKYNSSSRMMESTRMSSSRYLLLDSPKPVEDAKHPYNEVQMLHQGSQLYVTNRCAEDNVPSYVAPEVCVQRDEPVDLQIPEFDPKPILSTPSEKT
uniref:Transmembrane protein n=1 Tax=Grammatophora oceanica TaxID=210454 RepID=A0A7S1V257_9STRA